MTLNAPLTDLFTRMHAAAAAKQAALEQREERDRCEKYQRQQNKLQRERELFIAALTEAGLISSDYRVSEVQGVDEDNADTLTFPTAISLKAVVQANGQPLSICWQARSLTLLLAQSGTQVFALSVTPYGLLADLFKHRDVLTDPERVVEWYDSESETGGLILRTHRGNFAAERRREQAQQQSSAERLAVVEPFAEKLAKQRVDPANSDWAKVQIIAALLANPARSLEPADAATTAEAVMAELLEIGR